jgi:hypothetical protein
LNRPFGRYRFWTDAPLTNAEEGYTALRLHRETFMGFDLQPAADRQAAVVAEVVYWDAAGHYYQETFSGAVPLEIIEEFIAEAKTVIRCE